VFKRKPKEPSTLEVTIEAALEALDPHDPDYSKNVKTVERLYKLKEVDPSRRVSPDTLAIVLGNLLGIALIITHERSHILTTKAKDYLIKPR